MGEKENTVVAEQQEASAAVVVERDTSLPIITMKKCLEAGCHFGHMTKTWNPKMSKYIYGARNGIYIIDLNKTVEKIIEAYIAMRDIVREGGKVLFVGTKEQIRDDVMVEALRSGSFYITNRWLGGTLTNFKTIQARIRHLKELEQKEADKVFEKLSKKELAIVKKEKERLTKNLEGIKEMRKIPNAIFISNPTAEFNAIKEAKKLGIKIFGIVDTNTDPDGIDFPIPSNNNATKSVKLVLSVIADAVCEAKGGPTLIAYTKDEGEEATMKDAIRVADKQAQERIAFLKNQKKQRLEREERERQERIARINQAHSIPNEEKGDSAKASKAPVENKKDGE